VLTIEDGTSAARIAPELGGMVTAFWSRRGVDVLHWFHPLPDELIGRTLTPKGGLFVLAPYSNKLRAGRLLFGGSRHAFGPHPESAPDGSHGYAARLPWEVVHQERERVRLALDGIGDNWPWRVQMEQELALEAGALSLRLVCRNADRRAMPCGGGFHPFFARTGGQTLSVAAATRWRTDPDTRPLVPIETGGSADAPLEIALDPLTSDRFFGDWAGNATLHFPTLDAAMRLATDPVTLPYLLLFCPPGRPLVCVEPVSHLTGAFELPEEQAIEQGMRIIAPGQAFEATLQLTPIL
jgi:aldose 1-epimerase